MVNMRWLGPTKKHIRQAKAIRDQKRRDLLRLLAAMNSGKRMIYGSGEVEPRTAAWGPHATY